MAVAPNFANRTMWTGDNLDILRGLNSDSIDLVYADPPFNSNKTYEAPIGSKAAGAAFKDSWTLSDVDDAWHGEIADREPKVYAAIDNAGIVHGPGMKSYLIMMAVRLLELRRVLKPTGSLYLHCDPTANAYLRVLLDAVWGTTTFRNEIAWCYTGPANTRRHFPRKHDTVLMYAGTESTFNREAVRVPYKEESFTMGSAKSLAARNRTGDHTTGAAAALKRGKVPEDWWHDVPSLSVSRERVGFPTQKPLALLDRIIKASSNPGDVVLDPFCGCATACVSAESLDRKWIGIDLSPVAATLVESRLRDQFQMFAQIHHRTDIPRRTDLGNLPNYRTHTHTLFGKQEGHCGGGRITFPFRNYEVDHVIPRAKGARTTSTTCSCSAAPATGRRAPAPRPSRSPSSRNGANLPHSTPGHSPGGADTTTGKTEFLTAMACPTLRWRRRGDRSGRPDANAYRIEEGLEVGRLASERFPDGIRIDTHHDAAVEETRQRITDPATTTLFEPAFKAGKLTTRVDILDRNGDGWDVVEVKSSLSGTSKADKEYADLAYTVMVVEDAGIEVRSAALMLLSRDYRDGHSPEDLFVTVDRTEHAKARAKALRGVGETIDLGLGDKPPEPKLNGTCRRCEYWRTTCLGSGHAHTVLELPKLHHTSSRSSRASASSTSTTCRPT